MITDIINSNSVGISWKKFLISTLSSGVLMWLIAGLWHTVIAITFYESQTDSKHEGLGVILLAYLVLAFLMTYLYRYINSKKVSIAQSAVFGGIIGLLWVFPHELAMAGAHGESISYVIKNALWHIVEQGLGALIIGLVFKFPFKE